MSRFRDFLREHGETPEGQELIAAKLMGRWRSGAPLVLAPDKDDPTLGADPQRNNDFNYKEMDPHGYAVPLGSHMRRLNPRDTAVNLDRRRMIRRGATYGPALPENVPDDGAERGIAAFVICASLVRQFEFAQKVWINDRNFHELGNEHDTLSAGARTSEDIGDSTSSLANHWCRPQHARALVEALVTKVRKQARATPARAGRRKTERVTQRLSTLLAGVAKQAAANAARDRKRGRRA